MNGKSNKTKILALVALAAISAIASSQQINVVVNGEPVTFQGVGPQQVNGRVLVPLRGVMEKLGAYVGWDQATRTVTADKSGVDVVLHIGDRHATVNGRDVYLDVPAQEIGGSTMVPLRFVGEALGADVGWNPATYTVNITTTVESGSSNQQIDQNQYTPPRTAGRPNITSFDVDHSGTVRGGEELRLTLVGTPGGQATFSIPGVIQDVPMTETQAGVYVGSFRVPANSPINITRANAVGRLVVNGQERVTQMDTAIGLDTQPPIITAVTPREDSRVTRPRPNISVSLDDGSGSGVDPTSVQIRLDGDDVTRDAQITATSVTYRPLTPLPVGRHDVTVTAQDRAGNPVTKTWTFHVVENANVIRSFNYDAGGQPLLPGTEVTFTMTGEPGGQATFSVGDRVIDRPMTEVQPGRYVGTYTIRRNDNFEDLPVTARLVTQGNSFTYEAANHFTTRVGTLEPPTFSDPAGDSTVGDQIVLRGQAAPGSRVHLKVDYSKTTLGIFRTNGTVAETEVIADDNGRWRTDPIDLNTGLGGGAATFTVTAYTVGANGKQSAASKLTLHR